MMAHWIHALTGKLPHWEGALLTLLAIAASWAAARIYIFAIDLIKRRWASRTPTRLDDEILAAVRKPGAILIFLIGLYEAIHRYRFRMLGLVDGVLFVIGVSTVIYALIEILGVMASWYSLKLAGEDEKDTINREFLPLADKIIKIVACVIGLVIILDRFHIDIKSILVTLGVGSLAVGLALQDTLANIFGGFTILLDRPFCVGDRIRLQTGEVGDVLRIGMRSTALSMVDGNLLVVPNSLLVKTIVINLSLPDSRCLIQIHVNVGQDSDLATVKKLMLEAALGTPKVAREPEPRVFLKFLGDAALNMLLVCSVTSFAETMAVTDCINQAIREKFAAAGIGLAQPVRLLAADSRDRSPIP
jgi:small-conductance mechanosensitive channel